MDEKQKLACEKFGKFYGIVDRLLGEGGCPWDRTQTPLSMRADLFEESCEAVAALTAEDVAHSLEELGDVIHCAVMIAFMFQNRGNFSVADVFQNVSEKLVRRHPHIFGEGEKLQGADEVLAQWDEIKRNVEGRKKENLLDEVDRSLPPLLRAYKLQKKAAKKGFDWKNPDGAREKIAEELREVAEAKGDAACEEEIGDLLFAVVNWARKLGVNPENALICANEKFCRRFRFVEGELKKRGKSLDESNLAEMDSLWNEAKRRERKGEN